MLLEQLTHAIAVAPADQFWWGIAGASLLMLGAGRIAYATAARKRLIEDTPTSRIRSAPQGFVELAGVAGVFEGEPIIAPLTQRPCCWYRYRVEERSSRNSEGDEWRTLESGTSDDVFKLDDGDGVCGIDPEGAEVTPSSKRIWYGNERMPWREPPAQAGLFGWAGGKRYRYTEERIDAGSELLALGHLVTFGGAAPGVASVDVAQILREWKSDRATLLARFDRNNDGQIDMEEWEEARRAAQAEAAKIGQSAAVAPSVDLLSKPKESGRPFILSAVTEEKLRRKQTLIAFVSLVIAFCCGVGLAFSLLSRLR